MAFFDWDEEKNRQLQAERHISFELCVAYIEQGYVLDVLQNRSPRSHQKVFVVNIENYAYRIPFVEEGERLFLKTAYPSRAATKRYLS